MLHLFFVIQQNPTKTSLNKYVFKQIALKMLEGRAQTALFTQVKAVFVKHGNERPEVKSDRTYQVLLTEHV